MKKKATAITNPLKSGVLVGDRLAREHHCDKHINVPEIHQFFWEATPECRIQKHPPLIQQEWDHYFPDTNDKVNKTHIESTP